MKKTLLILLILFCDVMLFGQANTSTTQPAKISIDGISEKVLGTLFAALILFLFTRNFFKTKNISGEWNLRIKTLNSTYHPYIGLGIEYKVHLLLQDKKISGRGEKVRDLNPDGSIFYEYPNKNRVQFEVNGQLEKNYFTPSKIYLNIKESGTERTTSASYYLTVKNKNHLEGNFESTAADSKGEASWTRVDKKYQ